MTSHIGILAQFHLCVSSAGLVYPVPIPWGPAAMLAMLSWTSTQSTAQDPTPRLSQPWLHTCLQLLRMTRRWQEY